MAKSKSRTPAQEPRKRPPPPPPKKQKSFCSKYGATFVAISCTIACVVVAQILYNRFGKDASSIPTKASDDSPDSKTYNGQPIPPLNDVLAKNSTLDLFRYTQFLSQHFREDPNTWRANLELFKRVNSPESSLFFVDMLEKQEEFKDEMEKERERINEIGEALYDNFRKEEAEFMNATEEEILNRFVAVRPMSIQNDFKTEPVQDRTKQKENIVFDHSKDGEIGKDLSHIDQFENDVKKTTFIGGPRRRATIGDLIEIEDNLLNTLSWKFRYSLEQFDSKEIEHAYTMHSLNNTSLPRNDTEEEALDWLHQKHEVNRHFQDWVAGALAVDMISNGGALPLSGAERMKLEDYIVELVGTVDNVRRMQLMNDLDVLSAPMIPQEFIPVEKQNAENTPNDAETNPIRRRRSILPIENATKVKFLFNDYLDMIVFVRSSLMKAEMKRQEDRRDEQIAAAKNETKPTSETSEKPVTTKPSEEQSTETEPKDVDAEPELTEEELKAKEEEKAKEEAEAYERLADLQLFTPQVMLSMHEIISQSARTVFVDKPYLINDLILENSGKFRNTPAHEITADGKKIARCPVLSIQEQMSLLLQVTRMMLSQIASIRDETYTSPFQQPKPIQLSPVVSPACLAAWFIREFMGISPFEGYNEIMAQMYASAIMMRFGGMPMMLFDPNTMGQKEYEESEGGKCDHVWIRAGPEGTKSKVCLGKGSSEFRGAYIRSLRQKSLVPLVELILTQQEIAMVRMEGHLKGNVPQKESDDQKKKTVEVEEAGKRIKEVLKDVCETAAARRNKKLEAEYNETVTEKSIGFNPSFVVNVDSYPISPNLYFFPPAETSSGHSDLGLIEFRKIKPNPHHSLLLHVSLVSPPEVARAVCIRVIEISHPYSPVEMDDAFFIHLDEDGGLGPDVTGPTLDGVEFTETVNEDGDKVLLLGKKNWKKRLVEWTEGQIGTVFD
ncbi:hypothetical protein BLNAU_2512 [Blattamonas nauphoetae]|uniref:Uncharacterized protein n=1 Tax=Blattamonas nauphoetae TaxID=2049346 RepID=A0ABQ9YG25_9EUKA|nr:hypothetical protein BLNAU_2512 [Blattamonas nauphoetae]